MAGAGGSTVGPVRRPPGGYELTLRQADQARSDPASIEDSVEFIMGQVSKVPTRRELAGVAAGSFASGAVLATLVNLVLMR
jgi:hypothetical protein